MRNLIFALVILGAPAQAGELPQMPFLLDRGLDFLLDRIAPEINDLRGLIEDVPLYDPPQILPNGDIIIRRQQPPVAPPPEGQIDL